MQRYGLNESPMLEGIAEIKFTVSARITTGYNRYLYSDEKPVSISLNNEIIGKLPPEKILDYCEKELAKIWPQVVIGLRSQFTEQIMESFIVPILTDFLAKRNWKSEEIILDEWSDLGNAEEV